MPNETMSLEQKRFFYREGYVILRGAVSPDLVEAARARIRGAQKGENLSGDKALTDLVNASSITPIVREAMGYFDPPTACQVGVLKIQQLGDHFNSVGYRDRDMPYFGAQLHHDGNITISAPKTIQEGTPQEIYDRYIRSGPKGDIGRCAEVMGHNFTPLFQDPEMTLGLGSFTAFLFVCLNDQTEEGRGQTMVLPRSHHMMEKFFRRQRSLNGHMGPEGPGWPRLDHDAPNRCGMVYMPEEVRKQLIDETSERTPDGKAWPRPTPVLMQAGDACIATYNILHSGSRNERGSESRKNIIFRLRAKARQPNKVVTGVSDHPDRGWLGEWLDYEPGNNPWERSKDAMCDMWSEWPGLRDVVVEARRAEAQTV
jgi:ectoine hydroxylase-related dioxygenase (phytanoyl-CoA dioxygenase family)